jgi:glycosyltransferase involved in cell wall biosynthesis
LAGAAIIWFAASIPRDSRGGISRVMAELSSRLSSRGAECVIVNAGRSRLLANYLVFSVFLALKFIFTFGKRPAWIIARSTDGFAAALLARLFGLGLKTVLHSHGWEEKAYEAERAAGAAAVSPKTTWKARAIRFPLLRGMLALCDLCMCGTIEEARWIKAKYQNRAAKVVCVPNGVDGAAAHSRPWTVDTPTDFLCVGNATWKKNVGRAIDVFCGVVRCVPAARLTVIGCSCKELAALTNGQIPEGVSAVRSELPENMARRYDACPYLISGSRYEGGRSLAILEAMAHGCVVFASAIPSSKECIDHSKNGFILPGNSPAEDVSIIVNALTNPSLCAAISERAFLFAKRQSLERQARRLERLLCLPR